MKLLVDQNLAPRLASVLQELFPGSIHVRDVGLSSADDEEVWAYAVSEGFVIISKDADFHQRSFLFGAPPKVVWIRPGDCSTEDVGTLLRTHYQDLQDFEENEEAAFLALG